MIIYRPLPHFDERKLPITTLVLHSTVFNVEETIKLYNELKLSCHYLVDYDGSVYQFVSEDKRAWHAGIAYWRGETDLNSCSIGIEICHRSLGQSKYNKKQIASLIELCQDIIRRRQIAPTMIVGHSDIAPERKPDPGKDFPWKELAANDIGIWYGSRFCEQADVSEMLASIGYKTDTEQAVQASVYAFCRRFLPKKIIKLPVKKLVDNPYPADCEKLLTDAEVISALQNIYCQYKIYGKTNC